MTAEHVVLSAYVACIVVILAFSLSVGQLALVVRRERARVRRQIAPAAHQAAAVQQAAHQAAPRHRTPDHVASDHAASERSEQLPTQHCPAIPPAPSNPPVPPVPRVTVQLPIYNELHVAERVIDAAAALDYPVDRLCIQVLDDSTDETTRVVDAAAARHRARGIDVVVVRRARRDGYKAGALAHGLAIDGAELLLILDADFVPQSDLITRLLPHIEDPRVAAVQARWGYLNEHESLLTSVQAFLLGLHFRIEQPGRAASGGMLNFNGTAGMWRRAAIRDAGGWRARTVTEDIDLSYRVQLRGWRIVYLDDVIVPSELPADMGALRGQQHRWIRGGAQNARLHLRAVWRHEAPAHVRWHAMVHLLSGSLYAVILAMLVLSVPLAALKGTGIETDYTDWALPFTAATAALGATLAVAHQPFGIRAWLRFAVMLPAFLVFTMGLALHNGLAALSGLVGRPGGEFVRTAKSGGTPWRTTRYASRVWDRRVAAEVAFVAWLGGGLGIGLVREETAFIPLQLMALAGLVWVLTLSVIQPLQARRRARVPTAQLTLAVPQEVAL